MEKGAEQGEGQVRCGKCNALLFKVNAKADFPKDIQIKCQKCKHIVKL